MKKVSYFIESFVEKYNGIIQIFLLSILILINYIFVTMRRSKDDEKDIFYLFGIIITLIIGIVLELILLQIKDSAAQRKLNGIGEVVRAQVKQEDMWREETDLDSFFESVQHELFISGIIVDKLIKKYLFRIEELLDNKVRVKILIESFDELEESAKFLYGEDYNRNHDEKTNLSLMKSRLDATISYLNSLERLDSYFKQELLEIGLSNSPLINPSIIAYDYTKESGLNTTRTELSKAPEMSVRFYMQGVDGPTSKLKTNPTLLINSNIMAKQYDDFVKAIDNSWSYSKHITTKNEFDNIKSKSSQRSATQNEEKPNSINRDNTKP